MPAGEMDQSLQYQIYDQLRMLNNYTQNLTQSKQQDYEMFRQLLNTMQTQQAQMSMSQGMSGPYPGGFMNATASSAHDFLQMQAQGIYSGFGITPQMRQFVDTNFINPAMSFAQNQYAQTRTLAGATMASITANPAYTPMIQRELAAAEISSRVGMAGTSIAQGITSLAGGAAAVYGLGTAAASGALLPAVAVAGTAWAGSKVATWETLPKLTGGAMGGYSKKLFRPFDYMKEEIQEDKDIRAFLSTDAYRFISPESQLHYTGVGLSRNQKYKFSDVIRGMDKELMMEDTEIQEMMHGLVGRGLMKNIDDTKEFRKVLKEKITFIREASLILDASTEDVLDLMAEFDRAGMKQGNFDVQVSQLKGYAALMQKDVMSVTGTLLSSAKERAYGTGASTDMMFQSTAHSLALVTSMKDRLKSMEDRTPKQEMIYNLVETMGEENAERLIYDATNLVINNDLGSFLAAFATPEDGVFTFDREKMSAALEAAQAGTLDLSSLAAQGKAQLNTWTKGQQASWFKSKDVFFNLLDGKQKADLMGTLVYSTQNKFGRDRVSPEEALQMQFGLNAAQANLLLESLAEEDISGAKIDSYIDYAGSEQRDQALASIGYSNRVYKRKYQSQEILDKIFDKYSKPIRRLDDMLLNVMMPKDLEKYESQERRYKGGEMTDEEAAEYRYAKQAEAELVAEKVAKLENVNTKLGKAAKFTTLLSPFTAPLFNLVGKGDHITGVKAVEERIDADEKEESAPKKTSSTTGKTEVALLEDISKGITIIAGNFDDKSLQSQQVALKETAERGKGVTQISKITAGSTSNSGTASVDKATRIVAEFVDVLKAYNDGIESSIADMNQRIALGNNHTTNTRGRGLLGLLG